MSQVLKSPAGHLRRGGTKYTRELPNRACRREDGKRVVGHIPDRTAGISLVLHALTNAVQLLPIYILITADGGKFGLRLVG